MTLLAISTTSFLVALSGALAPGPLLTVDISESIRRGFRAGPYLTVGHGILELGVVGILVAGFSSYLASGPVTVAIGLLGGAVLIAMGLSLFRSWRNPLTLAPPSPEITPGGSSTVA